MKNSRRIPCTDPAALEIKRVLETGFGFAVKNPGCEMIWEEGFQTLDAQGPLTRWQETPKPDEREQIRSAIQKYRRLRATLETQIRHPIPWDFQAPTLGAFEQEKAEEIREKVHLAIRELKTMLASVPGEEERHRRLIIGLFWFVYTEARDDSKKTGTQGPPVKISVPPNVEKALRKNGLSGFVKHLEKHGGLGMSLLSKNKTAELTALEAIREKRGLCPEKSKVLYAVLRMADIPAFFVEPRVGVDYFAKAGKLGEQEIPLPGHMVTGVGVKRKDRNGKEHLWILDMSFGMVEADYEEKGIPCHALSLRQYMMAELSNVGIRRIKNGDGTGAKLAYEMALRMGDDPPVYHAATNYSALLNRLPDPDKGKESPKEEGVVLACTTALECSALAYRQNRDDPSVLFNYAMDMQKQKGGVPTAEDRYLDALKSDPRWEAPYIQIIWILQVYQRKRIYKNNFQFLWNRWITLLHEITGKGEDNRVFVEGAFKKVFSDREIMAKIEPNLLKQIRQKMAKLGVDIPE